MLAAEIEQTSLPAADRRLVTSAQMMSWPWEQSAAPAFALVRPQLLSGDLDLQTLCAQRAGSKSALETGFPPDVCVDDGRVPAPFLDDELEQGDAQRLDGMLLAEEG
eukprot:s11424_g1.t1